ncbi:MAG: hypothetical protein M3447_03780 [Acidobacteriota bacterium]|nr:hypothetical protein [Acidobacteriota bacterium]
MCPNVGVPFQLASSSVLRVAGEMLGLWALDIGRGLPFDYNKGPLLLENGAGNGRSLQTAMKHLIGVSRPFDLYKL